MKLTIKEREKKSIRIWQDVIQGGCCRGRRAVHFEALLNMEEGRELENPAAGMEQGMNVLGKIK